MPHTGHLRDEVGEGGPNRQLPGAMNCTKSVHGELVRELVGVPSFESRFAHRSRPSIAPEAVAPFRRPHARQAH
eukprot:10109397-Heterocapsa_arctica.AAC.1